MASTFLKRLHMQTFSNCTGVKASLYLIATVHLVSYGGCNKAEYLPGETAGTANNSQSQNSSDLIWNLGLVNPQSKHKHTFQIPNRTQTVWKITSVKSSCSCTVASIAKQQIEPGETLEVTVNYKSRPQHGDDVQRILLMIEGESKPTVLVLKSSIRVPLHLTKSKLVWAKVGSGQVIHQTFHAENFSGAKWSGLEITSESPFVKFENSKIYDDGDGIVSPRELWRCDLGIDTKGLPIGKNNLKVTVKAISEIAVSATLPIEFEVIDDLISMIPQKLVFDEHDREGRFTSSIQLVWRGSDLPSRMPNIMHDLGPALDVRVTSTSSGWRIVGVLNPEVKADNFGTISLDFGEAWIQKLGIPVITRSP
jgi:hypothetical protein